MGLKHSLVRLGHCHQYISIAATDPALEEGHHGKRLLAGLSKESARVRGVAQGKYRPRFDLGDGNLGDGRGGSLFCGATRRSDRILKRHRIEVRAPCMAALGRLVVVPGCHERFQTPGRHA